MKIRIDLGRAIGAQGRFADAIPHLKIVLLENSDNAEANFYMGLALVGTEQLSTALNYFVRAIDDEGLKNRIKSLQMKQDFHQALKLIGIEDNFPLRRMFAKGYSNWRI